LRSISVSKFKFTQFVLPFEYPPEEKAAGGEGEAEKSAGRSWQSCK
jgi:hypothetical protein